MGIAIICRNANYANKGLGKVTMGASTDVYPTSISISGSSEFSGASSQYSVSYTPSNANMTGVTWRITSGSEYATISSGGLLTMKDTSLSSDVTITIKATSTYSSAVYAEKTITWKTSYEEVYPTALTINGNAEFSTTTSQYSVGYTPSNANVLGVTWSVVSGGEYATIDQSGLLTMTDTSMTEDVSITIKAVSTADTSVYAEKTLTWVYVSEDTDIYPTALTINGEESFNGDSLQLSVGYTPTTTNKTEVTWSLTSGAEYASIDQNGLITMNNTSMTSDVAIGVKVVSQHDSSVYTEKTITWLSSSGGGDNVLDSVVWIKGFWYNGSVNTSQTNFACINSLLPLGRYKITTTGVSGFKLSVFAYEGEQIYTSAQVTEMADIYENMLSSGKVAGYWNIYVNFGREVTDDDLSNMSDYVTIEPLGAADTIYTQEDCTIEGYGIDSTNGEQTSYNNYLCTDYIDISGYSKVKQYIGYGSNSAGLAFYDSSKAYISGVKNASQSGTETDIPSNAVYMRFDTKTNDYSICVLLK